MPDADAYVTERGEGRGVRAGEILRCCDLDVAGLAGKSGDGEASPFGERRVVGEIAAAGGGGVAMRVEQGGIGEGLRCLH